MPFRVAEIPRAQAARPAFVACEHGCSRILSVTSGVSGEVEFELCAREAAALAPTLAQAAGAERGMRSRGGSFRVTAVPAADARWPQYLVCDHGCGHVVQIGHPLWRGALLEICAREAAELAVQLHLAATSSGSGA